MFDLVLLILFMVAIQGSSSRMSLPVGSLVDSELFSSALGKKKHHTQKEVSINLPSSIY